MVGGWVGSSFRFMKGAEEADYNRKSIFLPNLCCVGSLCSCLCLVTSVLLPACPETGQNSHSVHAERPPPGTSMPWSSFAHVLLAHVHLS